MEFYLSFFCCFSTSPYHVAIILIPCVSFSLSDFSQPVSFENAEIGQCPNLAPPPPPAPLPEEEETEKKKEDPQPPTPATGTPPTDHPDVSGNAHNIWLEV